MSTKPKESIGEDLSVSQKLLLEEYKQVGENLRLGWNYISGFFRTFVFLQIALIGFLGVGVTVVNVKIEDVSISSDASLNQRNQGSTESPTNASNQNKNKAKSTKKKESNWKHLYIFVLCMFGSFFAYGGREHNKSLFAISKVNVGRASVIESQLWNITNTDKASVDDIYKTHFTYMDERQKMKSSETFNIEKGLFGLYTVVMVGWFILGLFYAYSKFINQSPF